MKLYAIVDIETTGGSANRDKITEIAIVHHDGEQITDYYTTLIHPERSIPAYITGITGITNDMVADAPRFYEVAAEIIRWTEGRIFVAHNVHFDYRFIKEEFKSLGYTFTRHTLDTVKLSRLAFPGFKSYSLSNLKMMLNIEAERSHRALDDAIATGHLFTKIMASGSYKGHVDNFIAMGIRSSNLPQGITLEDIYAIPESHGVYYFRNEQDTLIYVGKSKNLKTRIARHFSDHTEKSLKIRKSTHRFEYEETGNELAALIKESIEIRALQPLYNKAQRNPSFPYSIIVDEGKGFPRLEIKKISEIDSRSKRLKYFSHKKLAQHFLGNSATMFQDFLTERQTQISQISRFVDYYLGFANPENQEDVLLYSDLFDAFTQTIATWFEQDFLVIESGKHTDEHCVLAIINRRFYGYGYIDSDMSYHMPEQLIEALTPVNYHPELDQIIFTYLRKNPKVKIIPLKS